jgi:hypothetical protein
MYSIHRITVPTKEKLTISMLGWQVQAMPAPLSGAGLVQNMLQAAAEGKAAKKGKILERTDFTGRSLPN